MCLRARRTGAARSVAQNHPIADLNPSGAADCFNNAYTFMAKHGGQGAQRGTVKVHMTDAARFDTDDRFVWLRFGKSGTLDRQTLADVSLDRCLDH
jgi:hypothetical protein